MLSCHVFPLLKARENSVFSLKEGKCQKKHKHSVSPQALTRVSDHSQKILLYYMHV